MSGNGSADGASPDAIEDYLDELVERWPPGRPRELRHLLAEVEAHLRDDESQLRAAGDVNPAVSAVRRFGPVDLLVAAERTSLVRPLLVSGLLLCGIGALAVGFSGLVAAAIWLVAGPTAVIDVEPGRVLSAADCARWLAGDPAAPNCHAAAVADWVGEVTAYRVAIGLLGVFALVGHRLLRRRGWTPLPPTMPDTIAATAFGLAAAGTLVLAVDTAVVSGGHGWGQWAAATAVALPAAALYTVRLLNQLERQRPTINPAP
jgi:hypothetical protein